jgi:hypothetical protein
MTEKQRPAAVFIHLTATDEKGNPIGSVKRVMAVDALRSARAPLLVEAAAAAATALDEIVSEHYDIIPRYSV